MSPMPPTDDTTVHLAEYLYLTAIRLLRLYRLEENVRGPTAAQRSALVTLIRRGALTMGELAEAELICRSTTTRLIQGMESDGLVFRGTHPDDRRAIQVIPSARGWTLLDATRPRCVDRLATDLQVSVPQTWCRTYGRVSARCDR